jgi:hypothetical protein
MTQQQRTDLLATLVSLEGQSQKSPQNTSSANSETTDGVDSKSGDEVVIKDAIEDR